MRTGRLAANLGRALILALAFWAGAGAAQAPSVAAAKAEHIFRFLQYVTWPEGTFSRPDSAIIVGVVGDDDFARVLRAAVANRQAQGRPVYVVGLKVVDPEAKLQAVFVSRAASGELEQVAGRVQRPALIIAEAPDALSRGAVINLQEAGTRVQFEVNLRAARERNLGISAKLLVAASNVVKP